MPDVPDIVIMLLIWHLLDKPDVRMVDRSVMSNCANLKAKKFCPVQSDMPGRKPKKSQHILHQSSTIDIRKSTFWHQSFINLHVFFISILFFRF